MQIHNLIQGSAQWKAYRSTHFNASDAPAMMGVSPYLTRNDLLDEMVTGKPRVLFEKVIKDGHSFEALARPYVVKKFDMELFPITGSLGKFSASFDGVNMLGDKIWENKSMNENLRSVKAIEELGVLYKVQMEQQLMVSGADKCLFSATTWKDGKLTEELHLWYFPDMKLRAEIIAGWKQLEKDLLTHKPVVHKEKPKAAAMAKLPNLTIQAKGEITSSNLVVFQEKAVEFLNGINKELTTDQHFADAKETVKYLKAVEAQITAAYDSVIAQMETIEELKVAVDYVKGLCKDDRLELDKLVTKREQEIKDETARKARNEETEHRENLESEIAPIKLKASTMPADCYYTAMKGKRKLKALHDAVDGVLAKYKIAADEEARQIREKLAWCKSECEALKKGKTTFLFSENDLQAIIHKPLDDFKLAFQSHVDLFLKAAEEKRAEELAAQAATPEPPLEKLDEPLKQTEPRVNRNPVQLASAKPNVSEDHPIGAVKDDSTSEGAFNKWWVATGNILEPMAGEPSSAFGRRLAFHAWMEATAIERCPLCAG